MCQGREQCCADLVRPELTGSLYTVRCRGAATQRSLRERGASKPDQDAWAKPKLALQGIAPQARVRLLACALAALESQIRVLPEALSP